MKNLYFAALAIIFASCANEENIPAEDLWNGEIRLTSSNVSVSASRSISQDIQLLQFDANEKVDVFINENLQSGQTAIATYLQPLTCTTNKKDDKMALSFTTPQYFPQSGNGVNIFAVYPSKVATNVSTETSFTVKENQSENTDYKASDLIVGIPEMGNPVGKTKDLVNIKFIHKLSKIDMTLVQGTGAPNLTGATVKLKNLLLTTKFTPNTGTLSAAEGARKTIIAANGNIGGSLECSAIIVPQRVEQGVPFIEVTLASGGVLTYNLKNATDFKGGLKYVYNIKVNLTELTVTSSIKPWENGGGDVDGEAHM